MTLSWVEIESLLGVVGIYAILAMSLNTICGMTGLLQLGQAGFYAIGAYAAGLAAIYLTIPQIGGANFLIGATVAIAATGLFSLLIGLPCLRLKGDYLAIATLGFGEIVRLTLTNLQFPGGRMFPGERIGGATGISFTEFPGDLWPAYAAFDPKYAKWWVIWLLAAVSWLLLVNVKRSSFGRAMMCIREDEIAAKAMGIHVPRYKMLAFAISAGFAGLAGALFFHKELSVSPGSFTMLTSIEILLMVVLGGLGSMTGSVLGAVMLCSAPFLLRHFSLGEYQQLIYAFLLIILIRITPNGMLGMNETPHWLHRLKGRSQ